MKPTPVVAANWKCNGKKQSLRELVNVFNDAQISHDVECVIAPPFLHMGQLVDSLKHPKFQVSAQNCIVKGGAFTGEVSIEMLRDFGVGMTILGHSERRAYYGESNEVVAAKTRGALAAGMKVIACVGETLKDREEGRTGVVVIAQLATIAQHLRADEWAQVVLAYEPVWAIGTGRVATPAQAQDVHAMIRQWLKTNVSEAVANNMRILYGGSVTAASAPELYSQPDVNGFLVGGASLKPEFVKIIEATKSA